MNTNTATPETVYENRGGEVWERHPDGSRELFAEDIISKLTNMERERDAWRDLATSLINAQNTMLYQRGLVTLPELLK